MADEAFARWRDENADEWDASLSAIRRDIRWWRVAFQWRCFWRSPRLLFAQDFFASLWRAIVETVTERAPAWNRQPADPDVVVILGAGLGLILFIIFVP